MNCGHIEFVFHYRITEFMRLIVDNLDLMETDSLQKIADWMMKKLSGRVSPCGARFSIDEEDEVEVDSITVSFLYDLLLTCRKRQVDRVDFEVESEPRTVCWKCHCFSEEESSRSRSESQSLDMTSIEGEFEEDFIDFLNRLEQRQEQIKESALRILTPPRATMTADHNRIEKSVQTAPMCLPAEVFVPEWSSSPTSIIEAYILHMLNEAQTILSPFYDDLPPPDLSEYHDAPVKIAGVEQLVDVFDLDTKIDCTKSSGIMKCVTASPVLSTRDLSWRYEDFIGSWERSLNMVATPWSTDKVHRKSLPCQQVPSCFEDLLALQETAAIAQRVEKKWNRTRGNISLSMTAALSTGVGGVDEEVQATSDVEKSDKKKDGEEWVSTLLKMLEQKPARSRKLLKGLLNYSKEHKSTKASKKRCCENCRVPKATQPELTSEPTVEAQANESDSANTIANVYEYMKLKLKEHERAKKSENSVPTAETKLKKQKKDINQHDIRAYMIGKKISNSLSKTTSAQTDIRGYCIGKKVKKDAAEKVEVAVSATSPEREKPKTSKKSSSKQRLTGKYMKLTKAPTLAVAGESSTKYIGRLTADNAVYGKTFKVVNLSRKELQISISPANWPAETELLNPESVTAISAGQTSEVPIAVSTRRCSEVSECLQLRMLHRNVPLSHTLSFNYTPMKKHFEGPLLSDLYYASDITLLTKLRKPTNEPRIVGEPKVIETEKTTEETVNTVVDMLKDEVECLCSVLLTDANVHEKVYITQLQAAQVNDSHDIESVVKPKVEESLIDSVHTAIEDESDFDVLKEFGPCNEENDSAPVDFEIVDDVDEGASVSSDQFEMA